MLQQKILFSCILVPSASYFCIRRGKALIFSFHHAIPHPHSSLTRCLPHKKSKAFSIVHIIIVHIKVVPVIFPKVVPTLFKLNLSQAIVKIMVKNFLGHSKNHSDYQNVASRKLSQVLVPSNREKYGEKLSGTLRESF
jgi:hypothetical protein